MAATEVKAVVDWDKAISEFTDNRQAAREHIEKLRAEKQALALESAMGGVEARKQLAKINAELARLSLEGDDLDDAIAAAENEKQQATQAAAANAEENRRSKIARHLDRYFRHVHRIDAQLVEMAVECKAAWQELQDCEGIMTDAERAPIHQLHGRAPLTFAAAFRGLDAFMELGPSMAQYRHRQPLAQFAAPFVAGWNVREQHNGQ
jgi:uncharacterized protein YdcH (DUF465 family)